MPMHCRLADGSTESPPSSPPPGHRAAQQRRGWQRRGLQRRGWRAAPTVVLVLALTTGGARAAGAPPGVHDPLERLNRATYAFNDALDRMLARPAARAYKAVAPRPVRESVGNFLGNLDYPTTVLNNALQGKLRAAGRDVARFVVNSTIGIGGLLDPATHWGLTANDEDFGQTLGVWGVGPGPYLVLPFLGPSDCRDAPARIIDRYTNVSHYARDVKVGYADMLADLLDRRTILLSTDAAVKAAFDPYTFVRNSYLERREYRVRDGNVPVETFDDELPGEVADRVSTSAPTAATPGVSAEPAPPPASPPPH